MAAINNQCLVNEWMSSLPQNPPTDNMMLWMKSYIKPCSKSCCYSPDCACIRCDNCLLSLTSNETPSPRNICIECSLVFSENLNNFIFQVPKITLCDDCFESEDFKHEHTSFCKVNENGEHIYIKRMIGIAPLLHLKLNDFPIIKNEIIEMLGDEARYCQCCQEEFNHFTDKIDGTNVSSSDDYIIPVSSPGCLKNHGMPNIIKNQGYVTDTHKYMCRNCSYQYLKSQQLDTYCGNIKNAYCKLCLHEFEVERWHNEFKNERLKCDDNIDLKNTKLLNKKEELKLLHLQPWIQEIIDFEFS